MSYQEPKIVVFQDNNLEYWIGLDEKDGLYSPYLFRHKEGDECLDGSAIRSGKWYLYEAAVLEGHRMYIRFLSQVIKDGELVNLITQ